MIFAAPVDVEADEAWLSPDPNYGVALSPAPWQPPRFRPPVTLSDAEERHLLAAEAWEVSPALAGPDGMRVDVGAGLRSWTVDDVAAVFDVPPMLLGVTPRPDASADALGAVDAIYAAVAADLGAVILDEEIPDPRSLAGAHDEPCMTPSHGAEYCASCGWTPAAHFERHGNRGIVSGNPANSVPAPDWQAHMPTRIGFADDGRPDNLDAQRTAQESAADELATGYHVGNGALSPAAVAERVATVTPPSEHWGSDYQARLVEAARRRQCSNCGSEGHTSCGAPVVRAAWLDWPEPAGYVGEQPAPALLIPAPGLVVPEPAAPIIFSAPVLVERGEIVPLRTIEKRKMLIDVVKAYSAADPRTLQRNIGPSEIGDPCDARIVRKLLGFPAEAFPDPWASFVGTAVHARLADAFEAANASLVGGPRFSVEQRVYVTDDIYGTVDLFHNGDVIDHKVVGTTTMADVKRSKWDANPKYRTQLDLYALGWKRAGRDVHSITLAIWPRSGFLDGLLLVEGQPDFDNAERALGRIEALRNLAALTNAAESDEPWQDGTIATVAGKGCGFCPFFRPNLPTSRGTCAKGSEYQSDKGNGRGPRRSVA